MTRFHQLKPGRSHLIIFGLGLVCVLVGLGVILGMSLMGIGSRFASVAAIIVGALCTVLVARQWQSDRRALQARLQQQELGYRSMFRDSPLAMCVVDDESDGFLAANEALCQLYGFSFGELLQLGFASLEVGPSADGKVHVHRRADGALIEVELSSRALRFGGRRAHLQQIRDLTAQRAAEAALAQSEARLRQYLERMPIACLVLDQEDRVRALNPAGERIFGLHAQQALGLTLFDCLGGGASQHLRFMLGRLRDGARDTHGITEHGTSDGRELVAEWFNTPLTDAQGVFQGCLCMVMDVSAQMADRSRLLQSHRDLADLSARLLDVQEQERRTLARELHDEVGQLLAALRIQLVALHAAVGAQAAPQARLDDALGIVDCTLYHIRNRALTLRPAVLDDLGVVPALNWFAELQTQRSGIPVQLELPMPRRYPEALEITVFRLVQEAVNNALKYAHPTHITVRLIESEVSLELLVADDGCGFDVQALTAGLRMGVAGMRERAALAGGHVQIESQPGAGTRVQASLPLICMLPAVMEETT